MKSKKVYLELMRVVAVILVLFNHLPGYSLYQISGGAKQWFYMLLTMLTRINVPLFLMITGLLLFAKEENFDKVLKKRVPRFCLVILFFEGLLFGCYHIMALRYGNAHDFTVKRFLYGILAGNLEATTSYWYLYAYLGLLLALPFMQRIAKGMKKQDFWALIIIHFLFSSLLPMTNILLKHIGYEAIDISGNVFIPLFTHKVFFYPLLGYYLENYVDVKKLKIKHLVGLLGASLVGIVLSCGCTYYEGKTTGIYTQNYVELFDYVTTISAFIIIKYLLVKVFPKISEGKLGSGICFVGSLTFGIYLLDPFFTLIFYSSYASFAEPFLPTLIVSIGWCMISVLLGGTTTYILKKLPILGKIL